MTRSQAAEKVDQVYGKWKSEHVDTLLKFGLSPVMVDGILQLAFWGGWNAALNELSKK